MAGPVPVDPWSAGLMAAGSVAGAALQKPAMNAQQTTGGVGFDNSGWNVSIDSPGATQSTQSDRSTGLNLAAMLNNPLVLIGLAVAAYYLLARK